MLHSFRLWPRLAALLVLFGMLLLSGCHRGGTKDQGIPAQQMKQKFDMTIQAYKNGQFVVEGAVLSALDTGSHFAYLRDQGELPKTVLLTRSDSYDIRKMHLQFLARMVLDYKFTAYYEQKGALHRIDPVDTKSRNLQDYREPEHTPSGAQAGGAPSVGG